ncbi:MAG TPA: tetratricopeptide repeat protein [Ramlibacter sp.]|uniref:tetratricopeptide repeat protein n=1 Tax=Ramlibacter sp. TaxID=1917967 RepID=UPI002C45D333|nr:tetratricopeptide repeat protein [Ramlibacter sp.]HVZ45658.1 tetratricopeptide repeat protein [Ramlibacter sp.]
MKKGLSALGTVAAAATALAMALGPVASLAAAPGAEVVMVTGRGERRETDQTVWVNAAVNDRIAPGGSVRTLANSQMGVLMSDRTQIRLNQNSQLQIKSLAEATQWSETAVRLNAGRAWSQARPQAPPPGAGDGTKPANALRMETPTTTIGIRGTDWEVEVDPASGTTRIAVLSGTVDVGNEFGAIVLGPGDAAVAEPGQAPRKFQLVDPASRVQWVSSWKPQPRRWAGTDAARLAQAVALVEAGEFTQAQALLGNARGGDTAAARMLADLLMYQGEVARARELLAPHASEGSGDPLAVALLANALAREDRVEDAKALVGKALAEHPGHLELLTTAGDLAVLQGDAARARAAYLGALAVDPRSVDAWYGLGLVASERERVAEARRSLGEVLKLDPAEGRALAELAATESFAGDLAHARELLRQVLAKEPSNYQALTALGIVHLKSGRPREALEQFMKAGVIEPRHARAWLYSGVAFYQQGETDRALQAFAHAARLDPHDPVPYVMRGLAESDALDPGAAIASAREAQLRLPYLKSLNPVASNQKGSGNLGSALAGFGLEEWADDYAARANSPYWGASHLFLADRFTGEFNRNSELFKGYLTEPTAFGASNRRNSLVTAPGHYGRVEAVADRTSWDQLAGIASVNGMSVEPVPVAYFASADFPRAQSRDDASSAHAHNLTFGLGVKPTWQLGLFAFATDTDLRGDLRTTELPSDRFAQREQRADAGLNFRFQPDNQLWIKVGSGRQDNSVAGALASADLAQSLNTLFHTSVFTPNGTLDAFQSTVRQDDVQLRHAFTAGDVLWSWGAEYSRQRNDGRLTTTFTPAVVDTGQQLALRSIDAYVSAIFQPRGGLQAQLDVFAQQARGHRLDTDTLSLQVAPPSSFSLGNTVGDRDSHEINPRAGVSWEIAPLQTLRAVLQRWRRPASVSTLAPVETLGIAINDRIVAAGGLYERARVQFDGEFGEHTFIRAFGDHERVDNGLAGRTTAISDFELTQLQNLRARPDVFQAKPDLEQTPQYMAGRIDTLGLSMNRLLGRESSLAARYLNRDAVQTGALAGRMIPYVPRHFLQLDNQWAFGGQWLLGASATWRSLRYRDDRNLDPIHAGWAFAFTAYWESLDRHSIVEAILGNLAAHKNAVNDRDAHITLRYAYRF